MATARKAAAVATRQFLLLAGQMDEVTAVAYLEAVMACRENDAGKGDLLPYVYLRCRRRIITGLLNGTDFAFRRSLGIGPLISDVACEGDGGAWTRVLAAELASAAGFTPLERLALKGWLLGFSTEENAGRLQCTKGWTRELIQRAIAKCRAVVGLPRVRPGSGLHPLELSGKRGARAMRRRMARIRAESAHTVPPR